MSGEDSPSYQRRQALRQADTGNSIRVLDSYPLSKYFDLSQRLLDAFQKAVDGRRMDEAYVYGLRFAAFGVESLPKHKDWRKTNTYNKHKRRNAKQVEKVISMMEIIKQRMDAEEIVLQERRQAEEDERRQQMELEKQKIQDEEQEKLEQQRKKQREKSKTIEESAMTKLLAMQQTIAASKVAEKDSCRPYRSKRSATTKGDGFTSPKKESMELKPSEAQPALEKTNSTIPCSSTLDGTTKTEATPSKHVTPITRKMTPRTSKEQRTVDLLQSAIHAQEKRLDEIESTQIPSLVRLAKDHLKENEPNRDAALKCVAHKRSLERQVDVIKAAIFNMETQMFMLENAMEDRQVQKALADAVQAMHVLQQSAGVNETSMTDLTDLTTALPLFLIDQEENDEELLEELQEWITPRENKVTTVDNDDLLSTLSMPTVPASSIADNSTSDSTSFRNLLKAVLGE